MSNKSSPKSTNAGLGFDAMAGCNGCAWCVGRNINSANSARNVVCEMCVCMVASDALNMVVVVGSCLVLVMCLLAQNAVEWGSGYTIGNALAIVI